MHREHLTQYPSLREVLRLPAFAGCRLCSGEAGAEQPVQGVNITEIPDYDNWIKAGELLVTTGFALTEDQNAVFRLLRTAKEHGLSGVCIKPGRYLPDSLPIALLQLADELSLPLVEVPGDVRFSDLTAAVSQEITRRQIPAEQERRLTAYLRHLLSEPIADEAGERQKGLEYGLRLERPHRVIRLTAEDISVAQLTARHLAESCQRLGFEAWTAFPDEAPLLLLEELEVAGAQKLEQAVTSFEDRRPEGLCFGIGQPYCGVEGIVRADESAKAAMSRAQKRGIFLVMDDPAGLLRLMQSTCGQQPMEFVRQQLRPLLAQHAPKRQELMETLESWFRCQGNQREMARSLHLHYNTVSYRLQQLWELLQCDPDRWEPRLALETALYLYLNRGETEEDGL